MEFKDFILDEFDRVKRATTRVLDGLTFQEIMWRPGPETNSIGVILFHTIRSEDSFINARAQGKPQVWDSGKWFEKVGLPQTDTGNYTREQLAKFACPQIADLMAYADAVRAQTLQYIAGLTPDMFDKTVNVGRIGDISIGRVFSLVLIHAAQHTGEISYIRGVQRGLNG